VSGTPPTDEQRELLNRHLDELDRWNRRLNLTAIPRDRALDRHVVETLALLDRAGLPTGSRCADLGSGGGIPGLVIAILRPDVSMALVESDRRKVGFLVHVCGLLDLANVTVVAQRAEEMGRDPEHQQAYDAVVSRAMAPPPLLWALAKPLLRVGGTLWALASDGDTVAAVTSLASDDGARAERAAAGMLAVTKVAATPVP
jgi:16S rRNA (guanine527-N7)-methyltransferase